MDQLSHGPRDQGTNALCQSCFSVVFCPGCPKFCVELRKLPKNQEKSKKREKCEEEKEGGNAKNMKGVFAKVKTGLKKFV